MKIRNLTPDGDFTYGKGLQNYLTGNAAIALNIKCYLKLWVGNCFWALQAGINYAQLLDKGRKKQLVTALEQGIQTRYGVMGVNQLEVDFDEQTRDLTVTYDVATIFTNTFKQSITLPTGIATNA